MDNVNGEDCIDLSCEADLNNDDGPSNVDVEMDKENKAKADEVFKKITDLTFDDIIELEFGSEAEAIDFDVTYARSHGFVARKDEVGRDAMGQVNMRQLVCNREGSRSKKHLMRLDRIRDHRPVTRMKCPAKFRVHIDGNYSKWIVSSFVDSHNHALTPPEHVHLIPSYRSMSSVDKAQVVSLHLYGVRTCHIMRLMLGQKGGHADLGFCKKDLYNHIDRQKRAKIEDGDAFAALCYLQAKADNDPMSFTKFTTTNDGRLQHLFWADGGSRIDFECFGDVLAFDTTYKKNKYNKPLVIFCGYNHHGQTTIFASALVDDEKTDTYKWVLEAFYECMSNKHPTAVVTDGDNAMREAIKMVFPNASHRLCAWHLQQNAVENVRNSKFLEEFKKLIYANLSLEEFERQWKDLICNFRLGNNNWAKKMYKIKESWATAYMRDKLFCGIRTTSICEGINSFIKRYVQQRNSLVDFMHNFERALKEYKHNEMMADFKSTYADPVLTTPLHKLENAAAKIFTRNKFREVKYEIEDSGALNVVDRVVIGNSIQFKLNRFGSPGSEYCVFLDTSDNKFVCDCRLFESRGIPCRHIFSAMRHEHMEVFPSSLICKRWTMNAKVDYITSIHTEDSDLEKLVLLRSGALAATCNRLCNIASRDINDFLEVRSEIHKLILKIENRQNESRQCNTAANVIGDPAVVKTKRAPRKNKYNRKRKRCSNCKKIGHYKRKCPLLLKGDGLFSIDEEVPISDSDGAPERSDDLNGTQPTSSVQASAYNESDSVDVNQTVAPNKKQRLSCPTQQSVKECKKQHVGENVQSSSHMEDVQRRGSVPQSFHPGYIHNMPVMPHYPVYPMYPGVIPTVPVYHPQGQSLPVYPQYYGFRPDQGDSRRS